MACQSRRWSCDGPHPGRELVPVGGWNPPGPACGNQDHAVRSAAERNGLQVIDATCPLVTKVHKEAVRLARQGYDIVLIGHAGHVEVQGTMGHAPDRMHLVESAEDAEKLEVHNSSMLGCVTQTTLSVDDTREIMEVLRRRFPEILLPRRDDICYATQNRQDAVKEMTRVADV
ncbi:MAG: hypothetical protein HRU14_18065, partial [Planctomycetes bacterium]|nr:hypothetical protein [Planctomycetota bacterium]